MKYTQKLVKPRQQTLEGNVVPNKEELRASKEFTDKLMWALFGPMITTPGTVNDVTKEQIDTAKMHRLAALAHNGKIEEATDYEAMLYLSNLSLEQPLDHTAYNVYCYLFAKNYPDNAKAVFGDRIVTELEYLEKDLLAKLKRDIYRDQMKHVKAKLNE